MKKIGNTLAFAAGSLLVLSLGACGKKEESNTGMAQAEATAPASDAGMGAAGTAAAGTAAMTSYLSETGPDAAGRAFPLEQVTFASGSSTLDPAGQSALGEVAAVLKQHPNAQVTVTSHADPQGDAAANKKLAAARAVSVKNALSAAGVPDDRLMTNVVGESGSAPTAAHRQVELLVKRG